MTGGESNLNVMLDFLFKGTLLWLNLHFLRWNFPFFVLKNK